MTLEHTYECVDDAAILTEALQKEDGEDIIITAYRRKRDSPRKRRRSLNRQI
jgi:hypothetical protein